MYLDKNRPQFVMYIHLRDVVFYSHDLSWGIGFNSVKHAKVVTAWYFLLNYKKVMVLKYLMRRDALKHAKLVETWNFSLNHDM